MISNPITLNILIGAVDLEPTELGYVPHRLDLAAQHQDDNPRLVRMARQSAGVRFAFRTPATDIALTVRTTRLQIKGFPTRNRGMFELYLDGEPHQQAVPPEGNVLHLTTSDGDGRVTCGAPATLRFDALPEREKRIEIWFPHNEETEIISLETNAPITPDDMSGRPVWLHYGSSISQGANALTPSGKWTAVAARRSGALLLNLGLGGSALLTPAIARAIRDRPADLISIKIGINLVNTGTMKPEDFAPAVERFIDTVRTGHPDTPLLLVSPLYCAIHETVPGPTIPDPYDLAQGRLRFIAASQVVTGLTLEFIRRELRIIAEQRSVTDKTLRYIDGRKLFGADDARQHPLPDQLHPDDQAHALIGSRFAEIAFPHSHPPA